MYHLNLKITRSGRRGTKSVGKKTKTDTMDRHSKSFNYKYFKGEGTVKPTLSKQLKRAAPHI